MVSASSAVRTGVISSAVRQPSTLCAAKLMTNDAPMPMVTPTAFASLIAAAPAGPWWSSSAAMPV